MLKLLSAICVFTAAAAGCFAQSTIPPVVVYTTGMIGLAEGQTARFNVLNPGALPPALGPNCTAMLTFYGPNGAVLKSASVTAAPGQSQYLDLFADADLGLMIDQRKQVRATFSLPATAPPPATSSSASAPSSATSTAPQSVCKLVGTLEILDTLSGRTQATLGGIHQVPSGPVTASSN